MTTLVVICDMIAGPLPSTNISLWQKITPCFSGRKSCSSIIMNQMEPSTLYDLVIHSYSFFPDHDHDFENCQGAYKAHWVTEGNIMSYSKDIACIDVQRRSLLLFGDKSHYGCFEEDGCSSHCTTLSGPFDGNYEMGAQNVRLIFNEMFLDLFRT